MTHSGGKPHNVGDRGQRYEVRADGYPHPGDNAIGWCDHASGAVGWRWQSFKRRDAPTSTLSTVRRKPDHSYVATETKHDPIKAAAEELSGLHDTLQGR